jgi:hypothetical protein
MVEAFSYIHMRRLTPAPAVVSQVSDTYISTFQHDTDELGTMLAAVQRKILILEA